MKSISKKYKINMKHYKKALTAHCSAALDRNIAALKRDTGGGFAGFTTYN
jgi:hypothetical protein